MPPCGRPHPQVVAADPILSYWVLEPRSPDVNLDEKTRQKFAHIKHIRFIGTRKSSFRQGRTPTALQSHPFYENLRPNFPSSVHNHKTRASIQKASSKNQTTWSDLGLLGLTSYVTLTIFLSLLCASICYITNMW